jgi:hypothetical protein
MIIQKQEETESTRASVEHKEVERYILNTHAFHNAHLLNEILSPSLYNITPIYKPAERATIHAAAAKQLHDNRAAKKQARAAKKAANGEVTQCGRGRGRGRGQR